MRSMTRCIRRAVAAAVVLGTLAALATPNVAAAAGKPQITAAGIDASDRLYAQWTLAPGTYFDTVQYSTVSLPFPAPPEAGYNGVEFFAGDNDAGYECYVDEECEGTQKMVRHVTGRVSRDRRYYVKVTAFDPEDEVNLVSGVWVIDEAKPVVIGRPGPPASPATNAAVVGRPYTPPPAGAIPAPTVELIEPPRKIATVLRSGVRARVQCPGFECFAETVLSFDSRFGNADDEEDTVRPGGRRTFVLKPPLDSPDRARLRRRTRVRLHVLVHVIQPGGKSTQIIRTLTVTR